MSDKDTVAVPQRSPFDAKPLDENEYRELLKTRQNLVLRVSDGTGDGTFRFWVEDDQLYWRCLNWTSAKPANDVDLSAVLDGDSTTQLLIEREVNDAE